MRPSQIAALVAVLTLGACGGHRVQKETRPLAPKGGYTASADPRPLVDRLVSLKVDPMPGGVIVRATGLPPTQGWWAAELAPTNDGKPDAKGIMTYRFVIAPPVVSHPASTPPSRDATAAAYLTDVQLASIRRIEVRAQSNSLSTSRH